MAAVIDEYLDLVDNNDEVIGKEKRSVVYSKGLNNFRVVNLFIINSQGKIWIPRRGPNKRIFPSALDMSMGGHVDSGETYEQAFKRELKEELYLDEYKVGFKLLGKLTPKNNNVSAFMQVYEIRLDKVPSYNPDDFTEFFWLSPQEVLDKLSNGDTSKGDLPKLIKEFYLKQ